ncbi:MAG: hypothetical protein IPK81_17895 [Rhodospirillales bacterium]|nr:MAG: hypothetical protein IPK81_17895 [Rhodospirillales bacterium]
MTASRSAAIDRTSSLGRRGLLAVAGALPMVSAVGARRAAAQPGGVTDLMPAFWRVYDSGKGASVEARAGALIADYFQPHLEVYRGTGIGRINLGRWLPVFDGLADEARRLSASVPGAWRAQIERFARHLPDAATDTPVAILVSFLNFDAAVRLWRGRPSLFIGLDGVARFHGPGADLGALFDHERFHLYHHQVNPSLILQGGDTLWLGIWKEGLAVHASAALNPAASRLQALLGDRGLAEAPPDLLRRVAAELPPVLHATDGQTRARYLSYGYRGDIPARSGYLLGLAIVERVARGRGLAELARIPAPDIEAIVRAQVAALAAG